jgi:hypothetical protein
LRRSWATSSQRTEGTRIASTQAYPVAGVKVRGGRPAPPSVAGLTFTGWQQPIACGGVAVFPNDVIVIDDDGAVLIPAALLDEMLVLGPELGRARFGMKKYAEAMLQFGPAYPARVAS